MHAGYHNDASHALDCFSPRFAVLQAYMVHLFEDAYLCSIHAKRVTLFGEYQHANSSNSLYHAAAADILFCVWQSRTYSLQDAYAA
jgi:hypothetical protein